MPASVKIDTPNQELRAAVKQNCEDIIEVCDIDGATGISVGRGRVGWRGTIE